MAEQTPSQTVGPFFHIALVRPGENVLLDEWTKGQRVTIVGTVLDGDARPVPDALIEIWQADGAGVFRHPSDPAHERADPHFRGFGRAATDAEGVYTFETLEPGASPSAPTPYINVRVFARGMLVHAVTRLYFPGALEGAQDPVLSALDPERRATLVARREDREGQPVYRFDIQLQGEGESVFFDL